MAQRSYESSKSICGILQAPKKGRERNVVGRASYYANKDSMLNLAVCAACQLGLVKIIDTLPGIGGYADKC